MSCVDDEREKEHSRGARRPGRERDGKEKERVREYED
jgi:hypothetical protein